MCPMLTFDAEIHQAAFPAIAAVNWGVGANPAPSVDMYSYTLALPEAHFRLFNR